MVCVEKVYVYPYDITLEVGKWYYSASTEVCPCDAHCKEVVWHSENPAIASVNPSSGYICANSVGTTRIYATATDGSGCCDYLDVTVTDAVLVKSVTLNTNNLTLQISLLLDSIHKF